jgi:hypothetical protein
MIIFHKLRRWLNGHKPNNLIITDELLDDIKLDFINYCIENPAVLLNGFCSSWYRYYTKFLDLNEDTRVIYGTLYSPFNFNEYNDYVGDKAQEVMGLFPELYEFRTKKDPLWWFIVNFSGLKKRLEIALILKEELTAKIKNEITKK